MFLVETARRTGQFFATQSKLTFKLRIANRPLPLCGFCGKPNTKEGHDACLGTLPDVMNACCGHGRNDEAYVQFWDKPTLRGEEAISFFNKNGVGVTIKYCFHHGSEDKEIPATMDLDTEYPKCDECYQYFVDADHNDGGARR